MSKEAALRAMREAKYASRANVSAPARGARVANPASSATRPPVAPPATKAASSTPADAPAAEGLCGHKSMNGRTCTREHGHAAKSHRYS